jgi:hypothetical protein
MYALSTTTVRYAAPRRLTIVIEGPYGRNERLDLSVTPGTTMAALVLDDQHTTLVGPGGMMVGEDTDLFEIAADTPRLFALREVRERSPHPSRRRL